MTTCFIQEPSLPLWKDSCSVARPLLFSGAFGLVLFDSAAEVAEYIVDNFIKSPLPAPFLLNVNIPNTTIDQLSGLVVTRLGRRHAAQSVIEQVNPRGETIYWLGAAGDARDSTQEPISGQHRTITSALRRFKWI